jgi:hypothetical protein
MFILDGLQGPSISMHQWSVPLTHITKAAYSWVARSQFEMVAKINICMSNHQSEKFMYNVKFPEVLLSDRQTDRQLQLYIYYKIIIITITIIIYSNFRNIRWQIFSVSLERWHFGGVNYSVWVRSWLSLFSTYSILQGTCVVHVAAHLGAYSYTKRKYAMHVLLHCAKHYTKCYTKHWFQLVPAHFHSG